MEYTMEEISPVKRKINIAVEPEEVDAAIAGAVAVIKSTVQVDGFRKGKVPSSVVEKKFHDHVYNEARENLINVHINDVLQSKGIKPLSGITMTGEEVPLKKGQPFNYSMEFEILPQFELPPYEGLEVEEEETVIDEKVIEQLLDRIRDEKSKLVPIDGSGPAKDGQIVNMDMQAFENGEPIEDIKSSGFEMEIGKGQALEEFETLVKRIPVGHTGEGEIKFPENFISNDLAGKTVNMKVTVHSIKEKILPPLDDALAKQVGMENVEKLKELVTNSYLETTRKLNKSGAEKRLLDKMLKMTDFPLPQSLVDLEARMLLTDIALQFRSQGLNLNTLGKSVPELLEDAKPQAEEVARGLVLLLSIANKENLEVTDEEVARDIYNTCIRKGEDFKSTFENMRDTGAIFHLRDRLLADKAIDLVYERAKVSMVPQGELKEEEETKSEDISEKEQAQIPQVQISSEENSSSSNETENT